MSHFGDTVYPETGNGGYTSVHTDVHLRYDPASNRFLPGNHVDLTERATHCLTDFSLDFERTEAGDPAQSPNMTVDSVTVNGQPASFRFVQPTYPGDPFGSNDPDPRAHQVSQSNPVGGPAHNPLPPACSPELTSDDVSVRDSQDGVPCPATKLVITPHSTIAAGSVFVVTVNYTGQPGPHHDADGSMEGWFSTTNDSSMSTEPVGTQDWMPLNNFPSAKPTYDVYQTTAVGKTAISNGQLASVTNNPPDSDFPSGSTTWHWHADMPIASYLVLSIIGDYQLTKRAASDGATYYEAQDSHISAKQLAENKIVMDEQDDITNFESQFNGPYPFASDGAVASVLGDDANEMQTMIVFPGSEVDEDTLYHETMHQWWGDHVGEDSYAMVFYKEGLATLAEKLRLSRKAEIAAGGPDSPAGKAAFQKSLVDHFNKTYNSGREFWTKAPSKPAAYSLLDDAPTYDRPGAMYIALWQILGADNFAKALRWIQRVYAGSIISKNQLEAVFQQFLPNRNIFCSLRLNAFFTEWLDTAYPAGGGANRPQITGPGLDGPNFYQGACTSTR